MSAILPPAERLWYRHPIDRVEGTWIAIALTWCLIMFAMMVGWHIWGNQNLSTETYRTTPEKFTAKAQAFVDKYTVRTETESKTPVVAPPPGSDVYLQASMWSWLPIIKLREGAEYTLHLSALDVNHGFSLYPLNVNFAVAPGYDYGLRVTPTASGDFRIICNEFCGIGHHIMVGRVIVEDGPLAAATGATR